MSLSLHQLVAVTDAELSCCSARSATAMGEASAGFFERTASNLAKLFSGREEAQRREQLLAAGDHLSRPSGELVYHFELLKLLAKCCCCNGV